jgi:hypothetical protein
MESSSTTDATILGPGKFSPAHRKKELRQAHFVINHFDTLTFEKLRSLVEPGEKEDE